MATFKTYREYFTNNHVEALQFKDANFDDIEDFVGGDAEFRGGRLVVAGPKGALWADEGDFIVRNGADFQVWPQVRFLQTYSDWTGPESRMPEAPASPAGKDGG